MSKYRGKVGLIYKLFVLTMLFMKANPYVNALAVTRIMIGIAFAGGAVLIGWDILARRLSLKRMYLIPLGIFFISYMVTVFLNRENGLMANLQDVAWFIVLLGAFFLEASQRPRDDTIKETWLIMTAYVTFSAVMVFGSLPFVFLNRGGIADPQGWAWGFVANRLFGLYRSPNYGALYSALSIVCSFALLHKSNIYLKVLLWINVVAQFLYVIYSGSNTGLVCVGVLIVVLCICRVVITPGAAKKVLILVCSSALIVGLFYSIDPIKTITAKAVTYITGAQTTDIDDPQAEHTKPTSPVITFERGDYVPGDEVGNGRIETWKGAMKVFPHYPIFGTSMRGYEAKALTIIPDGYDVGKGVTLHNDFVSMLVCTGIAGTLFLMIFIIWILCRIFIMCNRVRKEDKDLFFHRVRYCLALFFTIVVTMLFSDAILFSNTIQSMVLWVALGAMMCIYEELKGYNATQVN